MRSFGSAWTGELLPWVLCAAWVLVASPAYAYRTGQDSPALDGQGRVAWGEREVGFAWWRRDCPRG